jgi:hypothetical protein
MHKTDEIQHGKARVQKKVFTAKNQRKESISNPVVEAVNLEDHAAKGKVVFDPLLDSMLMNKADVRQVVNLKSPIREVISSPAANQPGIDQFDDDNCSSASEFVDATQLAHDDPEGSLEIATSNSPLHVQSSPNSEKSATSDRVASDMHFLKTSWANLAELEDQEPDDAEATTVHNQFSLLDIEEPFQQVVSKKKGKKYNAANKSYSTRSKVVTSNLDK